MGTLSVKARAYPRQIKTKNMNFKNAAISSCGYSVTMEILSFPFLFARKFSSMRTHFPLPSVSHQSQQSRNIFGGDAIRFSIKILNFLVMNTANFFLPSLLLALSLLDTSFAKCPPSEYSAPSGTVRYSGSTVRYSGFTDDNELNCIFNIRVPVSLRAILEIKKLKVMGRMPNCENGSLEIRVG